MTRISRSRMDMEDGRLDRAAFKDYSEIAVGSVQTVFTGVDSTYTIDIESSSTYNLVINANCSFIFNNPTGSGNACSFTLILKQDAYGNRTCSWPAAVRWPGGINPTLGSGPGDLDIITFNTVDGGLTWYGFVAWRDHQNAGQLMAWGDPSNGRLGTNTSTVFRSSPTQVGTDTNWRSAFSGWQHSLAIRSDNTLWSWGWNDDGQGGDNTIISRSSPVQIGTDQNWRATTGGRIHSLALKTTGTLWSWGNDGGEGVLGHNVAFTSRSSPTQVGALTNWGPMISGGFYFNTAIKTDGTLWAWGLNTYGDLGINTAAAVSSPTQVGSASNWSQTASGRNHTVLLKTDGTLWSTGRNHYGQLGSNLGSNRSSPAQVGSGSDWAQISTSDSMCAAVKTDGTLWTWGEGFQGALGLNNTVNRSSPTQVGNATDWVQVITGNAHSLAIKANGTLWSWGTNYEGRLGHNQSTQAESRSSPAQIGSVQRWISVAANDEVSFAIIQPS
jgi:alpha-tubulin suppressor-like RCC1 family protein